MIVFNKDSFTITVRGDKETYMETIKALNNAVADFSDKGLDYTYMINNLINDMLPDFRQVVNLDDAIELDRLRLKNRQVAEVVTSGSE